MEGLTWLEISRSSFVHNVKQFRKLVGHRTSIMAVVKSNAYGHGMVECAKVFKSAGADWLGVANLDEALNLIHARLKAPIMVLSYFNQDNDQVRQGITAKVRFPMYTLEQAHYLSAMSRRLNKRAMIHVKIDTGTTRLGVLPNGTVRFVQAIQKLPGLTLEGIFTHFADSENINQAFTNKQLTAFQQTIKHLEQQGMHIPMRHAACSASTIMNPHTRLSMVRLGISLYGLSSVQNGFKNRISLKPGLSWYTRIIQVKTVSRGTTVGYGRIYRAKRPARIAVLPVGYYEGYDRSLSNNADVLVQGKRAPVRGRICMNLTMVDVTHIPKVRVGDKVVLLGHDGPEEMTANELAHQAKTIHYEIVSRINPSLPRIITK